MGTSWIEKMANTPLSPADRKHRREFAAYAREHSHELFRPLLDRLYALWEDWNRDYFAGKKDSIDQYLKEGDSPADPSLDRRELAAYASVASLILNMDEMVTKQ